MHSRTLGGWVVLSTVALLLVACLPSVVPITSPPATATPTRLPATSTASPARCNFPRLGSTSLGGPHAYYDTLYGATLGWSNAIPLAYSEAWSDSLELLHPKQDYTWYAFEDTAGKMADPDYCPVNDSVEVRWTVYEEAGACTPPEADLNFYCGYTDGASISVTDSAFDEYEDCWGPLSVEMSSISATGHDSYVEVEWITASEIDNAGFNLYHSISKEGEKSQLNEALIPAQGDELQGASYSFTDEDVTNGVTYYYWLEDVDLHGRSSMHGPVSAIPTSVEERKEMPIPAVFSLAQNYPNPFNATTLIRYALPAVSGQQSAVSLKIYNIAGQEVRTLVDEEQAPGYYSVSWDGRDGLGKEVSSGIYFYRLKAGSYTEIRKMVLLK